MHTADDQAFFAGAFQRRRRRRCASLAPPASRRTAPATRAAHTTQASSPAPRAPAEKGWTNLPVRCVPCRKAKKAAVDGGRPGGGGGYGQQGGGYGGGGQRSGGSGCYSCGQEVRGSEDVLGAEEGGLTCTVAALARGCLVPRAV